MHTGGASAIVYGMVVTLVTLVSLVTLWLFSPLWTLVPLWDQMVALVLALVLGESAHTLSGYGHPHYTSGGGSVEG